MKEKRQTKKHDESKSEKEKVEYNEIVYPSVSG